MNCFERRCPCTISLILLVVFNTLGMTTIGLASTNINPSQRILEDFLLKSYSDRSGEIIGNTLKNVIWGLSVAALSIGGQIGSLIAGWWADKFGRKYGLLLNIIISLISYLLIGISKTINSFEAIIVARILMGFSCGLYAGICPIYISETSSLQMSGITGMVTVSGLSFGDLIGVVIGHDNVLGTANLWPLLLASGCVLQFIQIMILPFIPESPRHSYIIKGEEENAKLSLQKLRNNATDEDIENELAIYQSEKIQDQNKNKSSFISFLKNSWLLKIVFIGSLTHMAQTLTGFGAIVAYSTDIFALVFSEAQARNASIVVFSVKLFAVLINIKLIQKFGRRSLILFGLSGMIITKVIITCSLTFQHNVDWLKYILVASVVVFIIFFVIGPGTIPFLITSEMFPQSYRSSGIGITGFVNESGDSITFLSFPLIRNSLKNLSFLPFIIVATFILILLTVMLPETKNKTPEEIATHFGYKYENDKNETQERITRL